MRTDRIVIDKCDIEMSFNTSRKSMKLYKKIFSTRTINYYNYSNISNIY